MSLIQFLLLVMFTTFGSSACVELTSSHSDGARNGAAGTSSSRIHHYRRHHQRQLLQGVPYLFLSSTLLAARPGIAGRQCCYIHTNSKLIDYSTRVASPWTILDNTRKQEVQRKIRVPCTAVVEPQPKSSIAGNNMLSAIRGFTNTSNKNNCAVKIHDSCNDDSRACVNADVVLDTNNQQQQQRQQYQAKRNKRTSRRQAIWGAIFTCTNVLLSFQHGISCPPSHAACLSGDTSPDCIGVYKLPPLLQGDSASSYIDTPEHLAQYAPDLRWVPMTERPKSYKEARDELLRLQKGVQEGVMGLVQKGDLMGAGVELLDIAPRVTVTGMFVLEALQDQRKQEEDMSMRVMRTEHAHEELMAALGNADIVIGQAISGRYGSITMAQIQILDDLTKALEEFQDLMRALPETLNE